VSTFETVEIPMHVLPDGRKAITLTDYCEHDWVARFVKGWPDYFTFDSQIDCFVSPVPNEIPQPHRTDRSER
jgi:hypothetical protein